MLIGPQSLPRGCCRDSRLIHNSRPCGLLQCQPWPDLPICSLPASRMLCAGIKSQRSSRCAKLRRLLDVVKDDLGFEHGWDSLTLPDLKVRERQHTKAIRHTCTPITCSRSEREKVPNRGNQARSPEREPQKRLPRDHCISQRCYE